MFPKDNVIEAIQQMSDESTWEEIWQRLSALRAENSEEMRKWLREDKPEKPASTNWDAIAHHYDEVPWPVK